MENRYCATGGTTSAGESWKRCRPVFVGEKALSARRVYKKGGLSFVGFQAKGIFRIVATMLCPGERNARAALR